MKEVLTVKKRTKITETIFCGIKRTKYILRKNDQISFSVVRGNVIMKVNGQTEVFVTKEQREKLEKANR